MKRVIKNFASLEDDLRELLEIEYPNGIQKEDLVSFPTPQGTRLYGVEVLLGEHLYLIRIPHVNSLSENRSGPRIDYSLKKEAWSEEE